MCPESSVETWLATPFEIQVLRLNLVSLCTSLWVGPVILCSFGREIEVWEQERISGVMQESSRARHRESTLACPRPQHASSLSHSRIWLSSGRSWTDHKYSITFLRTEFPDWAQLSSQALSQLGPRHWCLFSLESAWSVAFACSEGSTWKICMVTETIAAPLQYFQLPTWNSQ